MLIIRSLFFAPANRADLVGKFPRFAADCYVIDLEDGTPPAQKASARGGLAALATSLREQALRGLLTVRVNEPDSDHYLDDLGPQADSGDPVAANQPQTAQSAIGQVDVRSKPLQMAMGEAGIAHGGVQITPD
jgi:citrate lyase beta subunit